MATASEAGDAPASGPAFCTVIAKNYLARARALSRSLRRHHPGVPLYVLLVDEAEGLVDGAREDFILVPLEALRLPSRLELCFRYELLELCTAVKPWFLRALFARGHGKLLFLDPDIWVYRPLHELFASLDEWEVLLTPHLTARLDDGRYPDEHLMLGVGAYNLGFLGLARSPGVAALLDWWWDRCEHEALFDPARGFFLDQRWMNLTPGFLDRVRVLRHPGYNLAHWNLLQREVTGTPEEPLVNGQPLHFLHASSVDPLDPARLSCPQTRFASLGGEPLLTLIQNYSAEVLAAGHQTVRHWPYTYDYFRDGQPIHPLMRRAFREQPAGRYPDPFSAELAGTFRLWAVTPADGVVRGAVLPPARTSDRDPGVMNRLSSLLRSRPELERMFPMPFVEEHDAPRFGTWIQQNAPALGWDAESVRRTVRLFHDQPGLQIEALYGRRADVERAFPRGILWPPDAGFLGWLEVSGRREHGLSKDWIAWFDERVHQHVCPRIVTLYRSRPDWRERHPRAFSPTGSAAFLAWLKTLPPEDLGFSVATLDHICPPPSPWDELKRVHRLDPVVRRAFPEASLTRRDTEGLLRWAEGEGAIRYGWEAGWHERLRESLPPRGGRAEGVTVVGYLRAESGMGELARSTVRGLRQAAYPFDTIDVRDLSHRHADVPAAAPTKVAAVRRPFTLAVFTAPDCTAARAPLRLPDPWSYVIGYWPWELETFPDDMGDLFASVDEVWALSRFSAAAIASASPVPVHTVWPALPDVGEPDPSGPPVLDPGEYNFLFVYDVLSETDRKNPAALVAAFRRAFRPQEPVRLTLKTINGEMRKDELRAVVAAADGLRVTVLDRYLARPDLLRLMAACDCYASLHRAEGFGFTLAEAMGLGKPVLATYYSANTEYMTPWNCFPVPYRLTEVQTRRGAYRPGDLWAEPDVEVAAELMRQAFRDREGAREVGARGQRDVRAQLSVAHAGARMAARLRTLVDAP